MVNINMNVKEVGNGRGLFWDHVETGCMLKFSVQLMVGLSCLIRFFFHAVTFVVIVQEEEEEEEGGGGGGGGGKPRHVFWN
jgi:hypothetical protein